MKRKSFLKAFFGLPLVLTTLSFTKKQNFEPTVFTEEMLTRNNFGLFLINAKVKEITLKNVGYAATVSWKLTWNNFYGVRKVDSSSSISKYMLTNFLTDGWCHSVGSTYTQVVDYLNNNEYGEKYRVMTKEEVTFIIQNRNQGFL